VVNIWIPNRTAAPIVLARTTLHCDRPNDPCFDQPMRYDIPVRGAEAPFWTRNFLQAGRSRLTLHLLRADMGAEVVVPLEVGIEPGMQCDIQVEIRPDGFSLGECRADGPFSISEF
jgi:hypothetical protein